MINKYENNRVDDTVCCQELLKEKLNIAIKCLNFYGNEWEWIGGVIDGREEGNMAREALRKINELS